MTDVANHLWQSTVVLVAIWALARALQHHRAATRHGLWLAASLKFLLPFDALFGLGRQFGFGIPGVTSTPLAQAVYWASEPFSHPAATIGAAVAAASGPVAHASALSFGTVALLAWLIGLLYSAAAWQREWKRLDLLARQHHEVVPPRLTEALARVTLGHAGLTSPALIVCASRIEPGIFGIWRPVLLWPRDLTSRLSDAEMDAILAHELCHVSRRDNLTQAFHALVSALLWFYPVIRLIDAQLHIERERACDEAVLCRGYVPHTYAESILKTCEFCIPTHALAAGATGSLRLRVVGILRGRIGAAMGPGQRFALGLAAAALVAVPVVFGTLSAPHLRAQTPATAGDLPAFELASVTPNASTSAARMVQALSEGRVNLVNLSVRELIVIAYQTQDHLVVGGPAWINAERFDIAARAASTASPSQMLAMARTLLADHFALVMHRETRDMPIYKLTTARRDKPLGPGLRDTTCVPGFRGAVLPDARDPQARFECGISRLGPGHLLLTGITLEALANRLGSLAVVGRSVVNRTDLDGRFDMELSFPADPPHTTPGDVSLVAAMQEQLGLTLEPSSGPVEMLVIDRVERPTPE